MHAGFQLVFSSFLPQQPRSRRNLSIAPPQAIARNGKKPVLESQFNQIFQTRRAVGGIIGGPRGAAARLGLKRTALVSKIKRLGIYRSRHQRSMSEFNEGSSARHKTFFVLLMKLQCRSWWYHHSWIGGDHVLISTHVCNASGTYA